MKQTFLTFAFFMKYMKFQKAFKENLKTLILDKIMSNTLIITTFFFVT